MKLVLPVERKISQKISSKMTFYQYETANTSLLPLVYFQRLEGFLKTRVFVYLIFFFHDRINLLDRIERLRYLYTKTYDPVPSSGAEKQGKYLKRFHEDTQISFQY